MSELQLISAKEVEKKKERKEEKRPPIAKGLIPLIEAEEVIPTKPVREPTGAKPIIPTTDGCCIGLCTFMNKEIEDIGEALKIRQDELKFLGAGTARMRTKRAVAVLTTKMSTLKDLRFTLADKNVCKCIEMPKK